MKKATLEKITLYKVQLFGIIRDIQQIGKK